MKLAQLSGLMLATTIGAGIFALPYVFSAAGMGISLAYLIVLTLVVRFSHGLYLRMLEAENGRFRLVGLVAQHLGPHFREMALLVVGGGLLLTLVAYLILGSGFLSILFPNLGAWTLPLFWLISTAPVFLRLPRMFAVEFGAALVLILLVLAVFGAGFPYVDLDSHFSGRGDIFLPFGIILFALAAWPAVEPIFEERRLAGLNREETMRAMNRGTYLSAFLYLLFVIGFLGSMTEVPRDVSSLILAWPAWLQAALLFFGLFAIWTSYAPLVLTLKNSFTHDLGWSGWFSLLLVTFLPLALVYLGLRDFFLVANLVGGVFLAAEYLFLLLTARRALNLSILENLAVHALFLVFSAAALYEIYYFVVQ